jgi:three-Cys-motif partner protein
LLNNNVTTPRETIWPIEPHTNAKHKILRKYLDAWFPILNTYNQRIVYVDGFSGPGRYTGGEPGSPIIAFESARSHRAKLAGELIFLFIEERSDRADHLKGELAKLDCPDHFKIKVEQGLFAEKLGKVLNELEADRSQIAPTFALIDPFGFSGIPYGLIQRLLSKDKCEVLITFMVDSINRWLEHPEENIRSHIADTFGTEEAFAIAQTPGDRVTALRNLYQKQLEKTAKFVRYFELRDRDGRVIYHLFFATNNALGHLKMKEAMWTVDPLGEFSFSDSTNPNQEVLFPDSSANPLVGHLASKFRGTGPIPVRQVETYVLDGTPYLRKHMGEALTQLESSGQIKVAETKRDGKKRRSGTYPNDALVSFR